MYYYILEYKNRRKLLSKVHAFSVIIHHVCWIIQVDKYMHKCEITCRDENNFVTNFSSTKMRIKKLFPPMYTIIAINITSLLSCETILSLNLFFTVCVAFLFTRRNNFPLNYSNNLKKHFIIYFYFIIILLI